MRVVLMGDSRRLRLRAAQHETSMKLFQCQNCGQPLHFENTRCERCGLPLGYLPHQETITALKPASSKSGSEQKVWMALADQAA